MYKTLNSTSNTANKNTQAEEVKCVNNMLHSVKKTRAANASRSLSLKQSPQPIT